MKTLLSVSLAVPPPPQLLSLSLFLCTVAVSLPSHSFSFHTSHSPCPFLLPCLSGYDDWGFSCSHLVEFLCTFVCDRVCMCVRVYVCVSPLSAEPCPCPCLLAARSHPAAGLWLGRGVGFLTQRSADCSRTCFNRWSRLESVITSARGLEERGCLPGAVWSPLPFSSKSQQQGTSPSMSDGRSGEETREGRQRGILTHSLTRPALCSPAFQVLAFFSLLLHFSFLLRSRALQPLSLLLCSGSANEFMVFMAHSPEWVHQCRVYVVCTAALCLLDFIVFPLNDRNSLHHKFLSLRGLESSTFH